MKRIALALAATFVLAAPALAQDQPAPTDNVTSYEFTDGDRVTGDREAPLGERLRSSRRGQRSSLIRPRPHFVPELTRTVENL